ncbi:MAG: DUF1570 domain-containing protein [Planctomycetia bacterium]|jgi:hypothetical protein
MQTISRSILTATLLGLLMLGATESHAVDQRGWVDVRTVGPFQCRADFSLEKMQPLFNELKHLQEDLITELKVKPVAEPIELYLFSEKEVYRKFLKEHFPEMPYRRAYYIKGKGPGVVLVHWSKDVMVDLRHECTHALLHGTLPVVPLWLDEGLAEYFEQPREKRVYDNKYLSKFRLPAWFGMTPKLAKLEKLEDFSRMTQSDYRNAWAWVHFMLHGSEDAHDELTKYIDDLARNTPPGRLSARLARRVPKVQSAFSKHLKSWKR